MSNAQTATTQYITASNGTRFAYRRLGAETGVPLVLHIHFRANMDFWDPLLLNTLGEDRPIIIFDQRGIGKTSGEVRDRYQKWADDLISFVEALGLEQIDLLGFSMGGVAVQFVALTAPHLIRKLICAGTTATVPLDPSVSGIVLPREEAPPGPITALGRSNSAEEDKEALAYSFFDDSPQGRAAFDAYWKRVCERTAEPLNLRLVDRDIGAKTQLDATMEILVDSDSKTFDRLKELKMPVLVANGDRDLLIPSSRSWELYYELNNAQLIMYPKAGHGFLWQYPELFAGHVNTFLDGHDYDSLV
jgi:pimeloyl-ACP methyl ester carboxylesterase